MWNAFLNKELLDLFKLMKMSLDAAFLPVAESEGLTVMQARILYEIKYSDLSTIGSLSKLMGENHGNCSSLCKKLENSGFVDRTRSKADERFVTLKLTPLGEHAVDTITNHLNEKFRPVLEATPPEKMEMMRLGMQVMQEMLQQFANMPKEG